MIYTDGADMLSGPPQCDIVTGSRPQRLDSVQNTSVVFDYEQL